MLVAVGGKVGDEYGDEMINYFPFCLTWPPVPTLFGESFRTKIAKVNVG